MSASGTAVNMQTLASGLTAEQLERCTWAEIDATQGLFRMGVIQDLERNDIRPEVRLNPAILAKFRPKGPKAIIPQGVGDFRYTLTEEWQSVRAKFANSLAARAREDVNLGARGMTTETLDEYGNVKAPPRAHRGFPGLIEIRMPVEAALIVVKE